MEWILPPCIIFKDQSILRAGYQDLKLSHDWRIESLKYYLTDRHQLNWTSLTSKIFIPKLILSCTTGRYYLLVLDGHGSHLTPEFDKYAVRITLFPSV